MPSDRVKLFNRVCLESSKLTTNLYSTSFSLGTRLFDKNTRDAIYAIYGFVRFADEIVDSFHNYNKAELLSRFKTDTFNAIKEGISLNPILQSFQLVVNSYKIDYQLIESFLHSMEMDLNPKSYNSKLIDEYIYGSAEVVGLMCLKVFSKEDVNIYKQLYEPARKLGAAFQKINFLRDMGEDFNELGRIYFPNIDFNNFSQAQKEKIESEIQKDFEEALNGIKMLRNNVKLGVYVAYRYYFSLFNMIKRIPPSKLREKRYRISNFKKTMLMVTSWACIKAKII